MAKKLKRYGASTASYKALSQVALNAAAGSRTVTWNVQDANKVGVTVELTAQSAATSLVVTPSISRDMGTTYAQMHSISGSTLTALAPTKAVSGVDEITCELDVSTADYLKIVVSGASGGAGDIVDVYISGAQ